MAVDIFIPTAYDQYAKCPWCKRWQHIDDYDVCGCDEGNIVCNHDWHEFRPTWLGADELLSVAGVAAFPPSR